MDTPPTFPRRWVPEDATFETWKRIEPYYRKLIERPIQSGADLEAWLLDLGELNDAVSEEGVRRYVAMTCQTDDPELEAAHLAFVREIEPKRKPILNELRSKYLDSPFRTELDPDRFEVFNRAQENRRHLYRDANVPRETRLAELGQRYQKTIGAMTVTFRGEERTLPQMAPVLEETDRSAREDAWRLVARRRLEDQEALDDLFDQMITTRNEIAAETGFGSYVDYAYRLRERFDYGVEQAEAFQEAVERAVVPAAKRIQESRRQALGLQTLRPWDLAVDPQGRAPLRPFETAEQLAEGVERIVRRIDGELGGQFAFLRQRGLLDLANRKGKAPGGYQTTFELQRLPFIFMNAVGIDDDVRTLLHEAGHAFHTLACRDQELSEYRDAPIEFCEVASMTMELLGAPMLDVFYDEADAQRSRRELLEGIILILPWIATVDAFQHWIYRHPGHSRAERAQAWNAILDRFGGIVDWSGLEEERSHSWHRQLHIFLYPFYYIEYGIAQLGALRIWRRSLEDVSQAVHDYRAALALGGSKPLPTLFETAGAPFDFSSETIRPLIEAIETELAGLDAEAASQPR